MIDHKYTFDISFDLDERLQPEESIPEPLDLLTRIRGTVTAYGSEDESEVSHAAYIEASLLDVDRINSLGEHIYEVCDSSDADLEGHAATFFDIESETLNDDLDIDPFTNNTIVLEYLFVKKQFRNLNLGKLVVDSLIRNFGGNCAIVILQAIPLQFKKSAKSPERNDSHSVFYWKESFVKDMGYDLLERDPIRAKEKLINAWEKLGFKIYKEDFMYRPIR